MPADWIDRRGITGRVQRFFSGVPGSESVHETTGAITGPPGASDIGRIAARLRVSMGDGRTIGDLEIDGIARGIVARATRSLEKLDGAGPGALAMEEAAALEAVVHTRGRPAARVIGTNLEDMRIYPNADRWIMLFNDHRKRVMEATNAAAALRVRDGLLPRFEWVQGTAVMISDRLALTNRHVLLPTNGGVRLVRRRPGTTAARLKRSYDIELDFAFDDGPEREIRYRVTGVPFVAADTDPVDAALIEIAPADGGAPAPTPLSVSSGDVFDIDRLYVVGHPGKLPVVPDDIRLVFGDPDERKRVSFGMLMDPVVPGQVHVVHDASTIGGFSGGAVHGFATTEIAALHYWGDGIHGNRAISASALRGHDTLGPLLAASRQ